MTSKNTEDKMDHEEHDVEMADEPEMMSAEDALEVLQPEPADDVAMDSDGNNNESDIDNDNDEVEEMTFVNDSVAYMEAYKGSVFCVAVHPTRPTLFATGGNEGDDDEAPGIGYVFDTSSISQSTPVVPANSSADPTGIHAKANTQLQPICALHGHTDSINAIAFTKPRGEYLVTGGVDGKFRVWAVALPADGGPPKLEFVAERQEVKEVTFVAPSPSESYPNTVAFGGSDGSVWIYTIEGEWMNCVKTYFNHTLEVNAGAWSSDGNLLATVGGDSALYVWDPFGAAAAKGLANFNGGDAVVALTETDSRFAVEGGLFSVDIDPTGTMVAAGGANGEIRIVSLPRLSSPKSKAKGQTASKGRAGQLLAKMSTQTDDVQSLAFAPSPQTLLASGSNDGSIAVFDTSKEFALRRHLVGAHDDQTVVKVDWVKGKQWLLTSCGVDGVLRRWDLRAGMNNKNEEESAMSKEWRGHSGSDKSLGIMAFVQADDGSSIVTAGDDGLVLIFRA